MVFLRLFDGILLVMWDAPKVSGGFFLSICHLGRDAERAGHFGFWLNKASLASILYLFLVSRTVHEAVQS